MMAAAPASQACLFADLERESGQQTAAAIYRCRHCEHQTKRPHVWRERFTRTRQDQQAPASHCRTCNRSTAGQAVRRRFSAAHRCDARCIYAKGPDCECSCAGANHGAGHSR